MVHVCGSPACHCSGPLSQAQAEILFLSQTDWPEILTRSEVWGLRSEVWGLRSEVWGLRSWVGSWVSGFRSPGKSIIYLDKSQDWGLFPLAPSSWTIWSGLVWSGLGYVKTFVFISSVREPRLCQWRKANCFLLTYYVKFPRIFQLLLRVVSTVKTDEKIPHNLTIRNSDLFLFYQPGIEFCQTKPPIQKSLISGTGTGNILDQVFYRQMKRNLWFEKEWGDVVWIL